MRILPNCGYKPYEFPDEYVEYDSVSTYDQKSGVYSISYQKVTKKNGVDFSDMSFRDFTVDSMLASGNVAFFSEAPSVEKSRFAMLDDIQESLNSMSNE